MGEAVWLLKHVGRHVQIVEARHWVELLERGELVGIQIEHFEVRHVLEFFNVRNFILERLISSKLAMWHKPSQLTSLFLERLSIITREWPLKLAAVAIAFSARLT